MAVLTVMDEHGNWQVVRDPEAADIANSKEQLGYVDAALDAILQLQEQLIGGANT